MTFIWQTPLLYKHYRRHGTWGSVGELLSELVEELQKVRLRERVATALRQAADIIDSQTPSH